jgi:hypothetical protein
MKTTQRENLFFYVSAGGWVIVVASILLKLLGRCLLAISNYNGLR